MAPSPEHPPPPMLFTRCPECHTNFRITEELLARAEGQVRCGLCHTVFDGFVDLQEAPPETVATRPSSLPDPDLTETAAPMAAAAPEEYDDPLARTDSFAPLPEPSDWPDTDTDAQAADSTSIPEATGLDDRASVRDERDDSGGLMAADERAQLDAEPGDEPADLLDEIEDMSLLDLIEDVEFADDATATGQSAPPSDSKATDRGTFMPLDTSEIVPLSPSTDDGRYGEAIAKPGAIDSGPGDDEADADEFMSAAGIVQLLEPQEGAETAAIAPPAWTDRTTTGTAQRRERVWPLLAGLAAFALALQLVNHFRDQLAGSTWAGPPLQAAYAALGIALAPAIDLATYRITEWTATAVQDDSGRNILRILASVENEARQAQPYPYVRLKLTDRWEATLGSRVFAPDEYVDEELARSSAFPAGATVSAVLSVVDPGPDAYGFELDICAPQPSGAYLCANDRVFE